MTTTITIKNDNEGFYGSSTSAEIDAINHETTLGEYNRQVIAAIRQVYTAEELEIELEYGPYGGRSIIVEMDDWDVTEKEAIEDTVSEIISRVYEFGSFWISK